MTSTETLASSNTPTVTPRIVTILVNHNNGYDTQPCIEALRLSTVPTTIVVVDNASTDGSGERLREQNSDIVYLEAGGNLGFTGGNNTGIAWALAHGAEYVWVLNNDTEVLPDCLERMLATARRTPNVGLVTCKMLYYDHPDRVWYAGGEMMRMRAMSKHWHERELDSPALDHGPQEVSFATGCSMLIPADVLRRSGGFADEYFMYHEDSEFCLRLQRLGYSLVYEPSARLLHKIDMTGDPTPFQLVKRELNRRRLVAEYYGSLERLRFVLFFYPSRAVHVARYLALRDWARAKAVIVGTFRKF